MVVGGGETLQPVLHPLAVESVLSTLRWLRDSR